MKRFLFLLTLLLFYFSVSQNVFAAGYDVKCVKEAGEYTKELFDALEGKDVSKIKFLSPVINLTYNDGVHNAQTTIDALAQGAGSSWNKLDGIAGNAYNMLDGNGNLIGTITSFIDAARGNSHVQSKSMMITEIGWYPHNQALDAAKRPKILGDFKSQLDLLKSDSRIIGATIFDVFGTNSDPNYAGQEMTDSELNQVCNGSCGKIGANSATYYSSGSDFYGNAINNGMQFTIEIANNDVESVKLGLGLAFGNNITNITPIIRIGVGDDGGGFEDPILYAGFLERVNKLIPAGKMLYAIAGPNEPEAETWASPTCGGGGGGGSGGAKISITGKITSSRIIDEAASGGKTAKTVIRPIEGAVIATYEGRGENRTGKSRGEIQNMFQWTTTNVDGKFLLYARRGKGFEYSNYVAFFCGHELKDLYKLSVDEDIEDFNVTLDCDTKVAAEPPTAFLNYANRNGWLKCYEDPSGVRGQVTASEVEPQIELFRAGLDDTYKGGRYDPDPKLNTLPPSGSEQSRKQLDGRFSLKQVLFDPASIRNAIYTIIGSCYDTLDAPREKTENSLISCNLIKECNNPLNASAGGTGRNSFLNIGIGLALGFPGQNKERYDNILNRSSIPVCKDNSGNEVKLSQIQPPWVLKKDCGSGKTYEYCPEYFPVWSLFGEPQKDDAVRFWNKTVNDSGENLDENADFRVREFSSANSKDKAHQPYQDKSVVVFPSDATGEFSLPRASCIAGEFCNADFDIPAGVLNYPFTPIGVDYSSEEEDSDLKLPKIGRGYYRMGLMESLCTCSSFGQDSSGCPEPMNKWNGEEGNKYAGGYTYITENADSFLQKLFPGNPDKTYTFYNEGLFGNVKSAWARFVDLFVSFASHFLNYEGTRGSACIGTEANPIDGTCDLANDIDCTATCTDAEGNPCDAGTVCTQNPLPAGITCKYYKLYDKPYSCAGDARVPFEANVRSEPSQTGGLGHSEIAAGLKEVSMPFWFPFENRRDVSALLNIDAETSVENLEFPVDKPLYGHDSGTTVGAGVYESDILRATVRDPVFDSGAKLNDPNKGIKGGGGGDCTPVASISGEHNVKPIEELINAIKNTGYNGQVDYEHIRKCYNTVVQTAISSGNDPAFMMATWIEESGAGFKKNAAQFGCKVGTPLDFDSQINCFKQLQSAYANNSNHEGCRKSTGSDKLQVLEYLLIFSEGESGCLDGTFDTNPNYRGQIKEFYKIVHNDEVDLNEFCTLPKNRWDSTCSSVDVGYCLKPGSYGPTYEPTLDWYVNINSTENDDGLTIPGRVQVLPEVAVKLGGLIRKLKQGDNLNVVAAFGYRSYDEQLQMCNECEALKQAGGTCLVAPAAQSIHRTGRAVDLYYLKDKHAIPIIKGSTETNKIISTAGDYGFTHPYDAGDPPHFEYEE